MPDYGLVLNAGSSSLKFCVFGRSGTEAWHLESRGQIDAIGTSPRIYAKDASGTVLIDQKSGAEVHSHQDAINAMTVWLKSHFGGGHVVGVGHRVVHGGAKFTGPTLVTPQVLADLRSLIPLAPLHEPYNIAAIEAVAERLPGVPQVVCFDTSFHRGQPAVAQLIPLPSELRSTGLQRYGFHGLSYEYIASVLPQVAPEIARGRVIVAHLGSGASLCALKDGKSIDCTFSFTALDGLCMGTRPGSLDPGAVLYLFQALKLSAKEVETILYKKSGLLGISNLSNDMRDLEKSSEPGAKLALDYFVYRATKEIGALAAVLGGIDGLVFTAGIGENSAEMRRRICESSAWLGIDLDTEANARGGPRISAPASKVSAWVIPTNEELMIALHTGRVLKSIEARV